MVIAPLQWTNPLSTFSIGRLVSKFCRASRLFYNIAIELKHLGIMLDYAHAEINGFL
jgi:hypothetical protein